MVAMNNGNICKSCYGPSRDYSSAFCSSICEENYRISQARAGLGFKNLPHTETIKDTKPVVIGDQLSRDEQIRIAALNAIKMIHLPPTYCMKNVIECADILEQYIKTGKAEQ